MNKKIMATIIIGIFLISFASAGWFDWLIKPKPTVEYKPAFNISNDFTINKKELNKEMVFNKLKETNIKYQFEFLKENTINLSQSNLFKENSGGIIRFKNE